MVDIILQFVIEIILLPVALVLATPIILISAFFSKDNYFKSVKGNYKRITKWWKGINF